MNDRDDVLRAGLWAAYDMRGSDAFVAACLQMLVVYYQWPLIAYHQAIIEAQADLDRRRAEFEAWYEPWLLEIADRCPIP